MSGISQLSHLQHLVRDSLQEVSGEYRRRPGGELQFDGDRPAGFGGGVSVIHLAAVK